MIGRTIGRYHILAKLGEGGMGSVWKAEDTELGRVVALKILPHELLHSAGPRRRFLREAKATSALEHPGIARLHEAGEADGEMFIATALVDGETVWEIASRGALPVDDAVRIAAEAAEALAHAHASGVIHRDVTSRNIMVARDGRAVVIDFGLAALMGASRITSSGDAIGTVAYLAPELVGGRQADARCDLYGLGVVLFEMLTASLPFAGDQAAAVIYAATQTPPPAPSSRRPGLSPELDAVVLRAMARRPEDRHRSAAELAAALWALTDAARPARPLPAHSAAETPAPERLDRLAVLPFRDVGADDAEHVVARGLAEAVSAALARVRGLQVIPPSAAGARAADPDARKVARELGAQRVLTGTLRRAEGMVRVSYSLIDVREGTQVAGDTFKGSVSDLLALEDQLVESVLRSFELRPVDRAPLRLQHPGAHEQYLRALGHLQRADLPAEVDAAVAAFEELIDHEGTSALLAAGLAKAYLEKFNQTWHPEWVRRAESSCHEALALDPHSPEVLVTLARVQMRTGKFDRAVQALRHALELRQHDPDALHFLSIAYQRLGDYARAEQVCRQAIAFRPEYWSGFNRLGTLFSEQGRHDAAIEAFRKVVELTPDNATGHSNLAATLFLAGRLEDAARAYERSIEIQPTPNATSGLGTVLFFLGRLEESTTWFQRAVDLNPRDPFPWGNLGDAERWIPGREQHSRTSFERAIELIEKQLEINPEFAESWSALAKWLAKVGRLDDAVRAIERALKKAPGSVASVVRAVSVYELAGERSRAITLFHRAHQMGASPIELENDPELKAVREEVRSRVRSERQEAS